MRAECISMVRIRGLSAKNILLYVPRPVARGLCTPSCPSLPPAELEAAPKKRSSKKIYVVTRCLPPRGQVCPPPQEQIPGYGPVRTSCNTASKHYYLLTPASAAVLPRVKRFYTSAIIIYNDMGG
jgi:hypothetical protein